MTIAMGLDSLFMKKKKKEDNFVLDIQCTVIGKLTDNMVFFQF